MPLQITNALTGRKEEFGPLTPGKVGVYVCGVTLYDSCHIGHARALIVFDAIVRYLRFLNYEVTYVRNLTDLDDKIIQKALNEGTTSETIAARYAAEFREDSLALGCVAPNFEPRATDHVSQMIELIETLEAHGLAYRANGDVFFSVKDFPGYGKLSKRKIEDMEAGARVEVNERKRDPMDFALWKSAKAGEPCWHSPWGEGRPGWHIECSAMSTFYLGQPFDIHGGGMDLIFPHHENEIAQSVGAIQKELAQVWIHNGFVNVQQEKMSKSLGNIVTIKEILSWAHPEAIRFFFLSSHYRSPIDYAPGAVSDASKSLVRIYETLARMDEFHADAEPDPAMLGRFKQAMDDDFNTPKALGLLFEELRRANRLMDRALTAEIPSLRKALHTIGMTLGILATPPDRFLSEVRSMRQPRATLSGEEVEQRIRLREQARARKDWQTADAIRSELSSQGIVLEDRAEGTRWRFKEP